MGKPGGTAGVWGQVVRLLSLVGVGLYLALFLYNSVTRTRQFSPDSMNYVDVARNIATGRGIAQSTLGYNLIYLFSPDSTIPQPFTTQPPLYPLLIVSVSFAGITYADAALVVPVIAYAVVLLLAFLLARDLYGEGTAVVAVGFLLLYTPLSSVTRFAWSEIVSIAFLLLSLWLLVKIRSSIHADRSSPLPAVGASAFLSAHPTSRLGEEDGKGRRPIWQRYWLIALAAGIAAGLTFSTRYALVPLFGLGIFFIVLELRGHKSVFQVLLFYLPGFGIPAGFLILRNLELTGAPMPPAFASDRDFISNLSDTLWTLFGGYSPIGSSGIQAGAAAVVLIGLVLLLAFQKRLREPLSILFGDGRYLLVLWSIGYLSFIVVLRSVSYFSPIDDRIIIPSEIPLVILFAAFCIQVFKPRIRALTKRGDRMVDPGNQSSDRVPQPSAVRDRVDFPLTMLYGALALAALILSVREIGLTLNTPVYKLQEIIAGSDRLSWIARQTTDRDLIIGDDTMDVPFYLGRDAAVSFSPYPHTVFFTYPVLSQFADRNCARYQHLYLILRSYSEWTYKDQLHLFGRFISDLKFGNAGSYPRVKPVTVLSDAFVFQVTCPEAAR
jgi:hypothetical protein